MSATPVYYSLIETATGGCPCFGGSTNKSTAFSTLKEARAALRASLDACCPVAPNADSARDECDKYYRKMFIGPPESFDDNVAALRRGEAVGHMFESKCDYNYKIPVWEENWCDNLGCCKITVPVTVERHEMLFPRMNRQKFTLHYALP